jgi:hypothetical protein
MEPVNPVIVLCPAALTGRRNRRNLCRAVDSGDWTMPDDRKTSRQIAPAERCAAALEQAFEEKAS